MRQDFGYTSKAKMEAHLNDAQPCEGARELQWLVQKPFETKGYLNEAPMTNHFVLDQDSIFGV
jgi:hypothetical protein